MGKIPIHERRKHFRVTDNCIIRHHEISSAEMTNIVQTHQVATDEEALLLLCDQGSWAKDILTLGKTRFCGQPMHCLEALSQTVNLSLGGMVFEVSDSILPGSHLVVELTWLTNKKSVLILGTILDCKRHHSSSSYIVRMRFDAMTETDRDWLSSQIEMQLAKRLEARGHLFQAKSIRHDGQNKH